jgi:hypothetical protein
MSRRRLAAVPVRPDRRLRLADCPYAAAARVSDLAGLQPADPLTCDLDPATRRRHRVRGFDVLDAALSRQERESQTAALRRALGGG